MSVKQVFNTSAELDYPTVLPTLDLDFANSKTLDPRITFTRASGGSYVGADGLIKLAGVNQARFDHDPVTGESLGLLVEEARTNLITYSSIIDTSTSPSNTVWGKGSNTTRIGTTTAPDGTNDAVIYQGIGVGANEFVNQLISLSASTTFTCTIWAKLISGRIPTSGNIISAAFSTGTVQRSNVPYANNLTTEWKRFSTTFTNVPAGSYSMFFLADANTDAQFAIWGAQLEEGEFPTSYIPTVASTRTRAADNASMTGKNFSEWYRPDEGTVYSNINFYAANNNVAAGYKITQGANLRGLGVQYSTSITSFFARTVASGFHEISGPAYSKKVAGRYKIGYSVDASIDGSVPVSSFSTSDPVFGTENQMDIGGARNLSASNNKFNGTISRLTYYPKVLTSSQLQTLTS